MTWASLVLFVVGKEGFATDRRKYLGKEGRGYGKESESKQARSKRIVSFLRRMGINVNLKGN